MCLSRCFFFLFFFIIFKKKEKNNKKIQFVRSFEEMRSLVVQFLLDGELILFVIQLNVVGDLLS